MRVRKDKESKRLFVVMGKDPPYRLETLPWLLERATRSSTADRRTDREGDP